MAGFRGTTVVACFVGVLGLALYPIVISPMIDSSHYKNIQKVSRKNIVIDEVQPGNMNVWSDPFGRKKADSVD